MATVVCERHGLRYDPERSEGCVICRRERDAGSSPAPQVAARPGARAALVWTAAIWLLGGVVLYAAHQAIADALLSRAAPFSALAGEDEP